MSQINQINLGEKAGIDTDHVQYWEMREGEKPTFAGTEEGPQTRVQFKNGKEAILRGDAKAAFDAWAAKLKGGLQRKHIHTHMHGCPGDADAIGHRHEHLQGRDGISLHHEPDRGEPALAPGSRPKCKACRKHNEEHGWCMDSSMIYPECYKERKTKVDKPLCKTCACYDAESQTCKEFAGNHYPECWVEREEEKEVEQLRREYLRNGAWLKPEPPEEAKVLLLSRIWECSKCGEVLATDVDGEPISVTDPQCEEIVINGEVRVQIDGPLLVVCWQCQTMNLWPKELRERVGG